MSRRRFLGLAPLAASLLACSGPPAAPASPSAKRAIRAICFDLFTLFDPRSVETVARDVVGEDASELCEAWRMRQFQYAFLRAAGGRYRDFEWCTRDALRFATKSRLMSLTSRDEDRLVAAYSELTPWPDTREQLAAFRAAGLRLAPLANYAPGMLARLLANADLTAAFDDRISTDLARTFKPAAAAYALGPARLDLPREAIAFAAFGGWDAAGAKWFGFPTFWVNRLGVPSEELDPSPDGSGPSLRELARFVERWPEQSHGAPAAPLPRQRGPQSD